MSSSGTIAMAEPASGVTITVCVPVYNVEQYLCECLDSIFSQDYADFDVVMVDDGSTDSSGAICDEYAARFPQQAFVVHKKNEGLLLARRNGFARAAGDYVMCVDSDDALVPGALSSVAAAVAETGADVVRFGFTREKSEAGPVGSSISFKFYSAEEKHKMLRALCCSTSGSENPMCFKAIRRSCVGAEVDFSEFKGLTFAEDFLQTLTVYDRARTFCFIDASLYYYRPGSGITRAYDPHFYLDVCRCLDVAEDFACRWEREYGCNELMAGLAACRLDSGAQYAEWMASRGDTVGLDDLLASRDFARCLMTPGTGELLRFDRRLVLRALRRRAFLIIAGIAKARAAKARR